jgi:hypothetical protein
MPRELHPENLSAIKTTEEARARGRNGGIKSGEAKRAKKLMSQIYLEYLAKKYKVEKEGALVEMTGEEISSEVISLIVMKGGPAAVSMLKEIREATEGNRVKVDAEVTNLTNDDKSWDDRVLDQISKHYPELGIPNDKHSPKS